MLEFIIFVAIIAAIGYGLYRFKIGPFKPRVENIYASKRMGKEPKPAPEPPVTPPAEPPAAP